MGESLHARACALGVSHPHVWIPLRRVWGRSQGVEIVDFTTGGTWLAPQRVMLRAAIAFFVIALIAALFGYGGIADGAADIGKLLFVGFLVIAVLALVVGLIRR